MNNVKVDDDQDYGNDTNDDQDFYFLLIHTNLNLVLCM